MKFFIQTYGCQMNFADSERIKTVFKSRGLEEAERLEDAQYIVLNSCAVRQSAENKLYGKGKQISEMKRLHPSSPPKEKGAYTEEKDKISSPLLGRGVGGEAYPIVVMTGCIVKTGVKGKVKRKSTSEIQNDIKQRAKWIDHALPTKHVFKKLELILDKDPNVQEIAKHIVSGEDDNEYLTINPSPYSDFQASLPISIGCNHHCSFCTVPYSRGEETFRTYHSIKKEYENYVKTGYKQITLLGQTVNKWLNPNYEYHPKAYGWYKMGEILPNALNADGKEPDNFLNLIKDLDSIKGDYRFSFISSYPNYFTDETIEYIVNSIKSKEGHIMPWIHLALQSGNNEMLKRMYRHYTNEEFKDVVKKFRQAIPEIAITTDIIVGFCNETDDEFQDSVKIMEEVEFDMAYISEYSVRPDTPADGWEDNIPAEVKRERKDILNAILAKSIKKRNVEFIGKKTRVLVEDRKHNNLIGKNEYAKDVEVVTDGKIKDVSEFIGKFVEVEVTGAGVWNLKAKFL